MGVNTAATPPPPPALPPPPLPGTGPGPLGVPGGVDRSYSVDFIVCAVATGSIGVFVVALRFYTRRVIINVLNWEDWLIVAAQIFSLAMCAAFIYEAVLGAGTHVWLISPDNFLPLAKAGWLSILFYELSLWCSQVSILLLYIRIWTFPWVRRASYGLLALVMVYNVCVFVLVFTACVPLQAFWDFALQAQGAYCHSKDIWWANTYLHVITDFMIYLLPMPVIFQVRFPKRQKILLFVLFAFGFFICAISIIRLYMLKITAVTNDFSFDNVAIGFWSCVETNGTVSIACFMTMKPLLCKVFPNLVESVGSREQQDAEAGSSGGVLTVGSKPLGRIPADVRRSFGSISISRDVDVYEQKH
ncbi:hypothetical protein B0T25DRAFT_496594 [Lasiosphaeria hispida]|uniref:Rhodopsin domain-containing protein n=1 Tax=Lasiosphaeria hispida TaxID=260671 RepID=A0AAJ0HSZ6_9PEZI|nr:hypothetical protein B0T25DRAFT_496594 [Lasiosphaeria hispida]